MDLNIMMREQALAGLNTQLDAATTNGDTAEVRKIAKQIADLTAATAPKGPPYGDVEIKAALEAKAPWFGVDPRKSGEAVRLGKDMNIAKFPTAEAFAEALIKAVEQPDGKTATTTTAPPENETDEEREAREAEEAAAAEAGEGKGGDKQPARRATDGPDNLTLRGRQAKSGPWTKLADAPQAVQADIKRSVEKFLPQNATKEQKEAFTTRALETHYNAHKRAKGK